MNLGALLRLAISRMYSPFLLARQTSRELGEMDKDPTGWFTDIVAPSWNESLFAPACLIVTAVSPLSNLGRKAVLGEFGR